MSTKQDIAIIRTTVNEEATDQMSDRTQFQFGVKEQHMLICEVYRYMMVGSAMMVCLAHGANDVANSISPLLTVFKSHGIKDNKAYLIGSLGIALGLLLIGYKVMETVGKKVIKLDFAKGFSA